MLDHRVLISCVVLKLEVDTDDIDIMMRIKLNLPEVYTNIVKYIEN